MFLFPPKKTFTKKVLIINTYFCILVTLLFLCFPNLDIYFSKLFFLDNKFISEKFLFIKDLRDVLKNFMIFISIISIFVLLMTHINKKQIKTYTESFRARRFNLFLLGLILGPVIGCGVIANLYFKDTWGRARPVHIEEFNGSKIYSPPFVKSDQCEKNCSWISGEASAAFSFIVGVLILKNPSILFRLNLVLGSFVIFCRLAMGGHFLSDNLYAAIFMIYLAIFYKVLILYFLRKKIFLKKLKKS